MRQIERFVSAASLPVARLLEDAGLKGPLVAEATAAIEAPALAAQRDLRAALLREGIEPVSLTTADRVDHVLRRFLLARRGGA